LGEGREGSVDGGGRGGGGAVVAIRGWLAKWPVDRAHRLTFITS
jgi:hypothetical protein